MFSFLDVFSIEREYLDVASVQDTAQNFGLGGGGYADDLDAILCSFGAIGLVVNEINRDMGLLDLTHELITPAIQGKLAYIHALACTAIKLRIFPFALSLSKGEWKNPGSIS
ncbi:hypothetical protein EQU24_20345 [Methylotuvimicrobium buryatense]|uniref:Uncharacterized protein n=1 Tax=Methylotuvimicrobium buryatense TaxID=95641 RepID=A0A4P9US33_METBY|nr:hypothetical protein EQU24_20345 [Methylotuvimicrobium buryatense]